MQPHLTQWCRLSDKEHVDYPEVFDDARSGEEGKRCHLNHGDRTSSKRASRAQRAGTTLRQRTGTLQGWDCKFRESRERPKGGRDERKGPKEGEMKGKKEGKKARQKNNIDTRKIPKTVKKQKWINKADMNFEAGNELWSKHEQDCIFAVWFTFEQHMYTCMWVSQLSVCVC